MKTIKDLEAMRNTQHTPFRTQYDYFFLALEDLYLTKLNGLSRIEFELKSWDNEAQKVIADKLIDMLIEREVMDFDPNEIIELIK